MKDLMVRDIVANIYYKGNATLAQIDRVEQLYKCKFSFKLGNSSCGHQSCQECYDTKIIDLEQRDEEMLSYDDNYEEDDEERDCDNCCGDDCDGCHEYSNFERN